MSCEGLKLSEKLSNTYYLEAYTSNFKFRLYIKDINDEF